MTESTTPTDATLDAIDAICVETGRFSAKWSNDNNIVVIQATGAINRLIECVHQLRDRATTAERERDEALAHGKLMLVAYTQMQSERNAALADNAALLEALNDAVAEYADATRFDKHGDEAEIARLRGIAEADHPGAVLLARIERLEALRQYVVHGLACEITKASYRSYDDPDYAPCTCGLAAALDALSETARRNDEQANHYLPTNSKRPHGAPV